MSIGMSAAPRCSSFLDAPLPGTAAVESGWLLIECDGGWGRDVFTGPAFEPDVRDAIKSFAADRGLRVLLGRRPGGARPERADWWVLHADSTAGTLRRHAVGDYAEIPGLDLAAGEPSEPVLAVCTHGKRDVCCALGGRPIAAALAGNYPYPAIWECSHTGGHRFAPVLIVLPTGHTYGRMTPDGARRVFDAARTGVVLTEGLRGRSCYPPLGQVAEVAVRELIGPAPADVLRIEVDGAGPARVRPDDHHARVRHVDGRSWTVTAESYDLPPRPASCGKDPVPATGWRVTAIDADEA